MGGSRMKRNGLLALGQLALVCAALFPEGCCSHDTCWSFPFARYLLAEHAEHNRNQGMPPDFNVLYAMVFIPMYVVAGPMLADLLALPITAPHDAGLAIYREMTRERKRKWG